MVSVDNPDIKLKSKCPGIDNSSLETEFLEVWDCVGEASFRGFIYQLGRKDKSLFLFFEQLSNLPSKDGLLALIELASECYECDRLVICLDRQSNDLHALIRDLGWFGFELSTLRFWIDACQGRLAVANDSLDCISTSEQWLFLSMEL